MDYDDSDSDESCPGKSGGLSERKEETFFASDSTSDSNLHYGKDEMKSFRALSEPKRDLRHSQRTAGYSQQPIKTPFPTVNNSVAMSAKRSQTSAGLRPYVSKRQNLITQAKELNESKKPNEASLSNLHPVNVHLHSDMSERARQCLSRKKGRMYLPRYVQHQFQGHRGPVNTVQWCPVPHLSHLLLSASMDKTFKVC